MSVWDSVKKVISGIAPVLGTALGGPLGGIAASTLSGVLLGKSEASSEEIVAAMANATPETYSRLREAEIMFCQRELEINAKDRANARAREIELSKDGERDPMPPLLGTIIIAGFFAVLVMLFYVPIPPGIKDIIEFMLGCLTTKANTICQYYFGSSSGSSRKTVMMDKSSGLISSIIKNIVK